MIKLIKATKAKRQRDNGRFILVVESKMYHLTRSEVKAMANFLEKTFQEDKIPAKSRSLDIS